ncbi:MULTISPECIES: DUF305 domain-containing protein [Micromonospora]|uniref:DUF305 domain-containing protein n=1 Tax=Micromonospora TaxID=1873 RepID=UPI0003EEDED7|nr:MULTISPECIES: DUF305 domain-containing protein [Micromonospora]EWM63838.1 basic proline-rich protein [Micromonospora sp. M42]MBP1783278.1 uncharacterized protein (DUF305 family) [Micromonospora sp. HB375]MCK1810077.1 DUF305 domain-containing protein [Micromonospora sp. R42106]MCK1835228.1 DUF305 domain-containing protein [Micromonospora sp. R42003]MCK1842644.1 DUF305 domain-containing protein [Micromonospora sp. R42004]
MAADLSPRTRAAEPAGPRLRRASAALLGVMLTLAGCGGPPAADPSPPVPSATASAPDTTVSGIDALFLAMMVAHTEQTLEIVRLGLDRATDTRIRTLIAAVRATETDELATMREWLRDAGPSAAAAAARHDHSGHSDAAAGLARLRAAAPADADRVLVDVLSRHQRTAADLARAQVAAGTSERVRELARRIERSRTAEIELMGRMG